MGTFRDLLVYKKAFALAMEIFEVSKKFPVEERYALTDQIRRSSRSVCSCLGEGYRKRRYVAHFIAKVSDADMENSETLVWLDFCLSCGYITKDAFEKWFQQGEEVGRLLHDMQENPGKYGVKVS